jgi:CHAT domain-containing protein
MGDADPSGVEEPIQACREALARLAPDALADVLYSPAGRVTLAPLGAPEGQAELFHRLGVGYERRRLGDREENAEIALRAFRQALADTDRETDALNWAVEAARLGGAFLSRRAGEDQEDVVRGISFMTEAWKVFAAEGDAPRGVSAAMNVANAYLLVTGDERPAAVQTAIGLFDAVLQVRRREIDPIAWASTTVSLANAHMIPAAAPGAEGPQRARELLEDVLTEPALAREPGLRAEALFHLGEAYQALPDGDRAANIRSAAEAFQGALDVLPATAPTSLRGMATARLGRLWFEEGRWAKAALLLPQAIEIETGILEVAVYEGGRRAHAPSDLHSRYAYCLLRRERYDEALVAVEAGKTRLIALAQALTAARLGALDADLREAIEHERQSIRDLQNQREDEGKRSRFSMRLDDASFVAALAEAHGRLARLLAEARERRPGLDLDGLSAPEILALIPEDGALVAPVITSKGTAVLVVPHGATRVTARHVLRFDRFTTDDLAALLDEISDETEAAIEAVTRALWAQLAGRIAGRLRRLGARRVLLLPQGGLGLLPIHSAWREVAGRRRYLADEFEVTYAPSAYALDTARRTASTPSAPTALVAAVSRYPELEDIPSVLDEARAVAGLFGTKPLLDAEATTATILARAPDAGYLHLACHGDFAWGADPLGSTLYLAGDEPLRLSDVIGRLDLASTRLVTLSACDSGIFESGESPDEFIGLTAGFMQAGATGVLGTLWSVDDESTRLLVERFYRNHLSGGLEPAAALREAQHWLRNQGGYDHPYHWAAFTYNGA